MTREEYNRIRDQVYQNVMQNWTQLDDDKLSDKIDELVRARTAGTYVPLSTLAGISRSVYSSIRGFGVLDSILQDEEITEIMVNGKDHIFIEKKGRVYALGPEYHFQSDAELMRIIQRIAARSGRQVDQSEPICDTHLPDGSRVNVVLPPISLVGPVVTIRKFSRHPMTIQKLIELGSIDDQIAHLLERLVKARYNIFISGGTGSGKTTFLNALSNYIPGDERVITIEDSAELQITHIANLVSMETRKATSGAKTNKDLELDIQALIKSSLRMRPDRIIVGEVRGPEALDMLQAMNTGHDGSLSTGHANSAADMLLRLETMVLQGSAGLPLEAVRQQVASAVDIIIHLSRLRDHSRKVCEIVEVEGYENGRIKLNSLYKFQEDKARSSLQHVSGSLVRTANPMVHRDKLLANGDYEEV